MALAISLEGMYSNPDFLLSMEKRASYSIICDQSFSSRYSETLFAVALSIIKPR